MSTLKKEPWNNLVKHPKLIFLSMHVWPSDLDFWGAVPLYFVYPKCRFCLSNSTSTWNIIQVKAFPEFSYRCQRKLRFPYFLSTAIDTTTFLRRNVCNITPTAAIKWILISSQALLIRIQHQKYTLSVVAGPGEEIKSVSLSRSTVIHNTLLCTAMSHGWKRTKTCLGISAVASGRFQGGLVCTCSNYFRSARTAANRRLLPSYSRQVALSCSSFLTTLPTQCTYNALAYSKSTEKQNRSISPLFPGKPGGLFSFNFKKRNPLPAAECRWPTSSGPPWCSSRCTGEWKRCLRE